MAERPILFSAPMVRAILAGAKTVTRRPVVPAAGYQSEWLAREDIARSPRLEMARVADGRLGAQMEHPLGGPLGWVPCPFGAVGDTLWVRETFAEVPWLAGAEHRHPDDGYRGARYRATWDKVHSAAWTPSIHMPRWASRLTLEVTSVGVERVQVITDADVLAEGIKGWSKDGTLWKYAPADAEGDGPCWPWVDCPRAPRVAFARLWGEAYGAGAWEANPWVWRLGLKREEPSR